MRILMVGGTGHFSGHVTRKAVERGHEVTLYNRGQRAFEGDLPLICGERNGIRSKAAEIAAFEPDVVIDSICYKPPEAEDLVALFPNVQRLILISSVDVYGQDVSWEPITEDFAPQPVSDYGKGKLACEKLLLEAFGDRVTIFRPSHILGPGFLTTSLWSRSPYLVDRLRKGRLIPAIDGGRNLMTPVHAGDIAEWITHALETPEAGGQIFNAVGNQIITQKRYYEIVAESLDVELHLVAVPSAVFREVFSSPPQFNWHRPFSCRKAVDVLGCAPRWTAETMLHDTVTYMLENNLVGDCDDEPFDDRLVELTQKHEQALKALLEEKARAR